MLSIVERSLRIEIDADMPYLSKIKEKCIEKINLEYKVVMPQNSEKLRFVTMIGNSCLNISKEEEGIGIKEFIISVCSFDHIEEPLHQFREPMFFSITRASISIRLFLFHTTQDTEDGQFNRELQIRLLCIMFLFA